MTLDDNLTFPSVTAFRKATGGRFTVWKLRTSDGDLMYESANGIESRRLTNPDRLNHADGMLLVRSGSRIACLMNSVASDAGAGLGPQGFVVCWGEDGDGLISDGTLWDVARTINPSQPDARDRHQCELDDIGRLFVLESLISGTGDVNVYNMTSGALIDTFDKTVNHFSSDPGGGEIDTSFNFASFPLDQTQIARYGVNDVVPVLNIVGYGLLLDQVNRVVSDGVNYLAGRGINSFNPNLTLIDIATLTAGLSLTAGGGDPPYHSAYDLHWNAGRISLRIDTGALNWWVLLNAATLTVDFQESALFQTQAFQSGGSAVAGGTFSIAFGKSASDGVWRLVKKDLVGLTQWSVAIDEGTTTVGGAGQTLIYKTKLFLSSDQATCFLVGAFTDEGENVFVRCFDAGNGSELWNFGANHDWPGPTGASIPKGTHLIESGDFVYVSTTSGGSFQQI